MMIGLTSSVPPGLAAPMAGLLLKLSEHVSDFIGDNSEFDLSNLLNIDEDTHDKIDCSIPFCYYKLH